MYPWELVCVRLAAANPSTLDVVSTMLATRTEAMGDGLDRKAAIVVL